jgi:hypothetical protein
MKSLSPRHVSAELKLPGLNEWSFIRECSRAERCSVNVCPLDPLVALRTSDPLDRETRCPVSKPDRERFVSRMSSEMRALLPFAGLLESEWKRRAAARACFASMTEEQRARVLAGRDKGMAALRRARLSSLSNLTEVGTASDTSPTESGAKVGGADA